MISVSEAYRTELANDNRNFYCRADITFWNGDTLSVTNNKIWNDGFRIEEAVSGQSTFEIGACVIGQLKLILNNVYGDFDGYDFNDAKIVANIGLYDADGDLIDIDGEGGTTFQKGVFYVDEMDTNSSLITLTCLDAMSKFDVDYSVVGQEFPATLAEIVENICTACDVPYTPVAFPNSTYEVWSAPDTTSVTCRDILSMACQIACSWGKISPSGELKIGFFDTDFMRTVVPVDGDLDGGSFWADVDNADGGIFWNFNVPAHDAGTWVQVTTPDYDLSGFFKFTRGSEDVRVYGVYVTSDALTYLSGSDKNAVEISGNLLINRGDEDNVAVSLGDKLIYVGFRPFSSDHLPDPTLEAGDTIKITDHYGNTYNSVIMNTEFSVGERQKSDCTYNTNASSRFRSIVNARITGSTITNGNGDFNVDREGNMTAKNIEVADIKGNNMTGDSLESKSIVADDITSKFLTLIGGSGNGNSVLRINDPDESYASYFGSQQWGMYWYDPNDTTGFQFYRMRIERGKLTCYPEDAGSRRMLIDCQKGQIYSGSLEADGNITTYYGNYYVDAKPLTIKSGYTWEISRYIAGFTTTGSRDVAFFVSSAKPILASSVSVKSMALALRSNGYPYARSGSSGGTYTMLGASPVSVWNNGATTRTNEVERISAFVEEDGISISVRFTYAPTTTNGGTTAMANNATIGVHINAVFQFS